MSDEPAQFIIHDVENELPGMNDRVGTARSRTGHPVSGILPSIRRVQRTGRGALRRTLVATEDWDFPEVNVAIARDFGMFA